MSDLWPALTGTCKSCLLFDSPGSGQIAVSWLFIAALLLLIHWITYRRIFTEWWRRGPGWAFACGMGLITALVFACMPASTQPFICFQF